MERKPPDPALREIRRAAGLGMEFVSSIAAGLLLGWLLDRWLGTAPWFLVAGMGIGLVGGIWNFYQEAVRLSRRVNTTNERKRDITDGP